MVFNGDARRRKWKQNMSFVLGEKNLCDQMQLVYEEREHREQHSRIDAAVIKPDRGAQDRRKEAGHDDVTRQPVS